MSEYLKFLTILFCISPSLHLRCTNAGCRARSWLIRASVTSSSSLAVEINTLRPWSWMLSYWWHELQMEGWKWEGSKMDVCSLKFGDFLEDLGNSLFPNFFCPWDVSSLFSLYNAAKALFGNPWQECWWSLIFFFVLFSSILLSNLYKHDPICESAIFRLASLAWSLNTSNRTSHPQQQLP